MTGPRVCHPLARLCLPTHPPVCLPTVRTQEMESEEEQEGAGPIHLARPDWQSGRALKNLFAPGSPTAGGAEDADGAGGGGDSSGQAGGAAKSSGGSQAGEAGRALKGLFAPGSPATGDAEDGYGAGGGGDSSSPAGEGQ